MRYGSLEGFDKSGGIAIGTRLANSLNVFVGNEVSISGSARSFDAASAPRRA